MNSVAFPGASRTTAESRSVESAGIGFACAPEAAVAADHGRSPNKIERVITRLATAGHEIVEARAACDVQYDNLTI